MKKSKSSFITSIEIGKQRKVSNLNSIPPSDVSEHKTDDEVVVSAKKTKTHRRFTKGKKTLKKDQIVPYKPEEEKELSLNDLESFCQESEQLMNNSDLRDLHDLVDTIKSGLDFKALELSKSKVDERDAEVRPFNPESPIQVTDEMRPE